INGKNNNYKNYYFAPYDLESFIKSVKIPYPVIKKLIDSERQYKRQYKLIGHSNEDESFLESFGLFGDRLNIFYYQESEIKELCSKFNLRTDFNQIKSLNKPSPIPQSSQT